MRDKMLHDLIADCCTSSSGIYELLKGPGRRTPTVPEFEGMPYVKGIGLPVALEVHTVQVFPDFVRFIDSPMKLHTSRAQIEEVLKL